MKYLDRVLQRLRIEQVLPFIAPGSSVLDIGCSDGALRNASANIGRYTGVDPNAPFDGNAKDVRFIQSLFPSPLLDTCGKFDLAVALAVLEHVPLSELPAFAQGVARHLVPGGMLVLTVPHPFVDTILAILMSLHLLDGMESEEHHGYDVGLTPTLFAEQGFDLVRHSRFELGLNHLFVFRCSGRSK